MRSISRSVISGVLAASLVSGAGCEMMPLEGEEGFDEELAEDESALMDNQVSSDGVWVSGSAVNVQRQATAVAATVAGGFVVGATQTQPNGNKGMIAVRFTPGGKVDTTWNGGSFSAVTFTGTLNAIAVDASNRVLAAGWDNAAGNNSHFLVARYKANGVLDTSFGTPNAQGVRTGLAYLDLPGSGEVAYAIQPWRSGYVVGGVVSNAAGQKSFAIIRLKADGTPDTSFSGDGKIVEPLGASSEVRSLHVVLGATAAADRLIAVGPAKQTAVEGARDGIGLAAYTSTGALDTAAWPTGKRLHAPSGMKLVPTAAAFTKDGKRIYVVGQGVAPGTTAEVAFAAKLVGGALDAGFDGDGVSFHNAASTTVERATGVSLDRRERLVISGTGTSGATRSAWMHRVLGTGTSAGKADSTFYAGKFHKIDAPNTPDGTNESLLAVVANSGGYTTAVGQITDTTGKLEALVVRMMDEPHAVNFDATGTLSPPWINGYILSRLSQVAYHDAVETAERPRTLSRLGFTQRAYVETGSAGEVLATPALVVESSKVVIVSFMGTVPEHNLETDFDWKLIAYRGGKVHTGFTSAMLHAYAPVKDQVKASLAANPARKVWITGHSLGGAVATLFAYELELDQGIDVTGVMTYGAPRIGDAAFRSRYNARLGSATHRFVNHGDFVPSVPFTSLGFAHVGRQHFLNWDPADVIDLDDCTGAATDSPLCKKGVVFDLAGDQEYSVGQLLDDHGIRAYASHLVYMMPSCTRIGIACHCAACQLMRV